MTKSALTSLLLLAVLGGCGAPHAGEEEGAAPTASVQMSTATLRDIRETLSIDGTFAIPEGRSAELAATAPGRVVKVLVREGDRVSAGQLLATLDVRALAAESQSAASGAAASSAQADQARLNYKAAQADQEANLQNARLALALAITERDANVRQAEIELQRVNSGARQDEIAQAQQAVDQAKVSRDLAKANADRDRKLAAEGFVSGQQADASKAAYDLAESALKQTQSQLNILKRPEDQKAAELKLESEKSLGAKRVSQAQAALHQAEQGKLALAAKAQEFTAAKLSASQQQAQARAASAILQNAEIRSPIAGIVVRRALNPGDMADPAIPMFEVASLGSSIDFIGSLSTDDAAKAQVGREVVFPSVSGEIVSMGQVNPQTGLAPIRVRCEHPSAAVRSGTFATGQIVIRTLKQIVSVPKEAILTRDEQSVVFVVRDGIAHLTPVKLGPEDGGFVAIHTGVKAGETVVLIGQHELSDGAKVQPEEKAP